MYKGIVEELTPGIGMEPLPQCKNWITSPTQYPSTTVPRMTDFVKLLHMEFSYIIFNLFLPVWGFTKTLIFNIKWLRIMFIDDNHVYEWRDPCYWVSDYWSCISFFQNIPTCYTSTISLYLHYSLSVWVCLSVCLSVSEQDSSRIMNRLEAVFTNIEICYLGSKVKVTVTWNMPKSVNKITMEPFNQIWRCHLLCVFVCH